MHIKTFVLPSNQPTFFLCILKYCIFTQHCSFSKLPCLPLPLLSYCFSTVIYLFRQLLDYHTYLSSWNNVNNILASFYTQISGSKLPGRWAAPAFTVLWIFLYFTYFIDSGSYLLFLSTDCILLDKSYIGTILKKCMNSYIVQYVFWCMHNSTNSVYTRTFYRNTLMCLHTNSVPGN